MEFHWNLGRHAYFKKYLARIFIFRFNAGKRMTLILKIQLRTIFILVLISQNLFNGEGTSCFINK
jgi:hypothetical protein